MKLFDDYDSFFSFLMENLPESSKFELLYSHVLHDRNAPKELHDEKYGSPITPARAFSELWMQGYAYGLESLEIKNKSDDRPGDLIDKFRDAVVGCLKNLFPIFLPYIELNISIGH